MLLAIEQNFFGMKSFVVIEHPVVLSNILITNMEVNAK